jgi:hypothetical protein
LINKASICKKKFHKKIQKVFLLAKPVTVFTDTNRYFATFICPLQQQTVI